MRHLAYVCALVVMSIASTALARPTVFAAEGNNPGTGDRLMKFDTSNPNGTISTVGPFGVLNEHFSGIDFDRNGTLYGVSYRGGGTSGTGRWYSINQTSGQATFIGDVGTPAFRDLNDLTYNPATDQFVAVAFDGTSNYLYTINKSTGAGTLVGTINSPGSIFLGISADSAGNIYLEDYNGSRMRVLSGLNTAPMSATIGAPVLFAQGMTMDWSVNNAWYLAANWELIPGSFTAAGDVRLMNNSTGGTSQILGTWPQLPNNSYPIYGISDIAIKPVPEPAAVLAGASLLTFLSGGRTRRRG